MSKLHYLIVAFFCFSLLGIALFLQYHGYQGVHYPPCPLCILQRIGFLLIGISCMFAALFPMLRHLFHGIACFFALFGLGVAIRHAYVIAYPEISCGLDPLEVFINQWQFVKQLPLFFKADGFCSMPLPSFLGLSVPNWSLINFIILLGLLTVSLIRRAK